MTLRPLRLSLLCLVFALLLLGLFPAAFAASAAGPSAPEYGAPLDISALSGGLHRSNATGINNAGLVCGS